MVTKKDIGRMIKVIYKNSEVGETTGILLSCTQKIGILQVVEDFCPDAIEIFVPDKVKKIAKGKREKIYDKIYKNSDYYQEPGAFIKGGSLGEIFKAIRRLGHLVIIESVYDDEYYFDIGAIRRVTKESVSLRYFDATGEWDDSNVVIDYDAITCVKYGGRYSTHWEKYLEAT